MPTRRSSESGRGTSTVATTSPAWADWRGGTPVTIRETDIWSSTGCAITTAAMRGASMTIHRIEVPPALDARSTEGLAAGIERAAAEPLGVIVLAGGDGTFCRGIDFMALLAAEDAGALEDECARSVEAFVHCVWLLRSCGRPVVAAVDGETLGGGVGLVAACDLVVATERSTFGMPEMLFGLIPAITLPVLLERMTPQKARRYGWTSTTAASPPSPWAMRPAGTRCPRSSSRSCRRRCTRSRRAPTRG